jgi:hypothetical protein
VALRLAKQAVGLGLELDLHSGLRLEAACYAQVGGMGGCPPGWATAQLDKLFGRPR